MKKTFVLLLSLSVLFLLSIALPVCGFDIVPSEEYPFPAEEEFPPVVNIGQIIECGHFRFQIQYQPVLIKSFQGMIATRDYKYMFLRVTITNTSEESIGWLAPDSFQLQEVFQKRIYGTYQLDYLMSAKGAVGYSCKAFYSPIAPGGTLQTLLVFTVYPDVDNWIFTLSPHVFGEEAEETVQFLMPKAVVQ